MSCKISVDKRQATTSFEILCENSGTANADCLVSFMQSIFLSLFSVHIF